MSLAPTASFILGNLKYDSHAGEITATLGMLPCVNRFRVSLPAKAQLEAVPGDPASLELDGGEGSEKILTGKVAWLRRGLRDTQVVASDGGSDLSALRPAATYQQQSGKDVIRAMASDAGADVGSIDLDLPLAGYVSQQRRTAAEHIAYLSDLGGAFASFDGDGKLLVAAPSDGPADLALLYGREILDIQLREKAAPQVKRFRIGGGPAGSSSAPDALRYSLTPLPGGADKPGTNAVWEPAPVLRIPDAAAGASAAADALAASRSQILTCRCFLVPKLRPGMAIEIQELPNGLSKGPWLLTRVEHKLSGAAAGGTTTFEARGASSDLLGGLLGAALGAIGGLL